VTSCRMIIGTDDWNWRIFRRGRRPGSPHALARVAITVYSQSCISSC